jgi:hypothetical protein
MKVRRKKFKNESPVDSLLLREELELKRYRKQVKRDTEEREILLDLAIKKMEEKEKDDFIPIGNRRRRIKIL